MISTSGRFVGREDELRVLHRAWQAARAGTPQVVGVEGEAGIGKSDLVRAFLAQVPGAPASDAPQVVTVQSAPAGLVRSWHLLTEVLRRLPGGTSPPADDLADAYLVGQGLAGRLRGPLVLVVDDAHWADPPSLDALRYAVESLDTAALLVVIVHRPGTDRATPTAGRRPPVADPLAAWSSLGPDRCRRLPLGGLSGVELLDLAISRGFPLPLAAAARFHRRTGGNPSRAVQLLELVDPPGLTGSFGPLPVPADVTLLVHEQLAAAGEPTRTLLAAGAVLGRRFGTAALQEISGRDEIGDEIAEAVERGLLREEPGSAGQRLAFLSEDVWDVVYTGIPRVRRQRLHRAAVALNLDDAVWHRIKASTGLDDDLAALVTDVADDHARRGRLIQAAQFRRAALELTPRSSPHRRDRLLWTVEALLVNGDLLDAEPYAVEVAALATSAWSDYVAGYLDLLRARPEPASARLAAALKSVGTADRAADPAAPPDLEARICAQLAVLAILQLDYTRMREYGDRIMAAVGRPDDTDPAVLAFGWFARSVGRVLAGDDPDGEVVRELSRSAAFRSRSVLDTLAARGMIRLWTDQLEAARDDLESAVARAVAGETMRITQTVAFLAETHYRRGDLEAARRHGRWAVRDAEANARFWDLSLTHSLAVYPLAARGEWEEADRCAQVARSTAWSPVTRAYAGGAWAALAQARGDAEQLLGAAREIAREYDSREPGTHLFAAVEADALSQLGRLDEAEAALTAFERKFSPLRRLSTRATLERIHAQILIARSGPENHAEALRRCASATTLTEQVGLPLETARVELVRARALAARQRPRSAETTLRRARATFARLGAHGYEALTTRTATDLALDLEQPLLHGLTPAEHRLAEQILDGTDRSALTGTRTGKTVETHLTNLYRKLEVRHYEELRRVYGPLSPPGDRAGLNSSGPGTARTERR